MLLHNSSGGMMAVLKEMKENGSCTHGETLHYFFLLLSKMALNTLIMSFWLRSIARSFMGVLSISVYVVDLLLISSISWIWLFREGSDAHVAMCFSLAHGSTVYSMLPLPALLAGMLDYSAHQHLDVGQKSGGRTAGRCVAVLLVWTLAFTYSYWFTNTDLLIVQYSKDIKALVCPVQGSVVISYFNLNLAIVAGFILLLHYKKVPGWICLVNNMCKQRAWTPKSDLTFCEKPEMLKEDTVEEEQMDRPPLFISLTLCFVLNWTSYLIMSVTCDLLGFAVPAYATVNLFWTACANSLLAGITFWYNSDKLGPLSNLPDDICPWSFYWHLSKGKSQWPDNKKCNSETV